MTGRREAPAVWNAQRIIVALGYASMIAWVAWWAWSILQFRLALGDLTWLPTWKYLGLDFQHNFLAARAWLEGLDPYRFDFGDPRGLYAYPPVMLPFFGWTALVADFMLGTVAWALFIAAGCAIGVWQVLGFRRASGRSEVPFVAILGLVLWSAPVVFAMERGNCDVLVLILVLLAAAALTQPARWPWTLLAASCLALAATLKIYPLAVIAALFALRRPAAAGLTLLFVAGLVFVLAEPFAQWLAVLKTLPGAGPRVNPLLELGQWLRNDTRAAAPAALDYLYYLDNIPTWASLHSPADWWPALCYRLGVERLASWPVFLVNVVTLLPGTLWGLWRIFRASDAARLSLPVLLWLMTLATCWMPFSYDYNLIFLPLLVVALWDGRDRRWLLALLPVLAPWWLPFGPVDYDWVLARSVLKLVSLYVATWLLVEGLRGAGEFGRRAPPARLADPA